MRDDSTIRSLVLVLPLLLTACGGASSAVSSGDAQTVAASAIASAVTGAGATTSSSSTSATSATSTTPGATTSPTTRYGYAGSDLGIYCFAVNGATGLPTRLEPALCDAGELLSVTTDPRGAYAYAVEKSSSTVRAYAIDRTTGALDPLAMPEAGTDSNPVFITVDPSGRFVYVANYNASTVSAFAIESTSGTLTPVAGSPFAVGPSPNAVAIDLSGQFLYVANEGGNSPAGISAFTIDPGSGALTALTGSPFLAGAIVRNLLIDPAGRFLFADNTQTIVPSPDHHGGSVAVFAIDPATGALSAVPGSPFAPTCAPTVFPPSLCDLTALAVDPSGSYLYAGFDNTIVAYAVDAASGSLTQLGSAVVADAQPYAEIAALSVQNHILYAADDYNANTIAMFTIDPATGQLSGTDGSAVTLPESSGFGFISIAFTP